MIQRIRKATLFSATLGLSATMLGGSAATAVELLSDTAPGVIVVASEEALDAAPLESVLIAIRKAESSETRSARLEPISLISDYEPELAEPEHLAPSHDSPAAEEDRSAFDRPDTEANTRPRSARRLTRRVAARLGNGSDVAQAYAAPTGPQPAPFHGVVPGLSSYGELLDNWGDPAIVAEATGAADSQVLTYDIEPFASVEALIADNTVQVIRVSLLEPSLVSDLVTRLEIDSIEPVEVTDPTSGVLLGVTFPEKGLTLLTPSANTPLPGKRDVAEVDQIILQPLDSQAFAARAENRSDSQCQKKLNDLALALRVDSENAHALWLKAGVHRQSGQVSKALVAATTAVKIAPDNAAYHLRWAECLADSGKSDQAVLETRKVLDGKAPAIVRAQALHTMGRLASLGDGKIASKAIGFQNMAIEIADSLATKGDTIDRRVAKDLLIDAHLAVAREIARRDYGNKNAIIADWIGRASGLAEERILNDGGSLELRLRVACEALGALADMRPTKDPTPWVKEAEATAKQLFTENQDKLFRARIDWMMGKAYQYALRVEHTRGDAGQAFLYGTSAIDRLAAGAEPRTASLEAEQTVGQLYFYLGAINAVHKEDHAEAIGWYDKARPILTTQRPTTEFVVLRRAGESLVSMAVSYWQQDQRDLAVELTTEGARLMERGVASGVLEEPALAVPYGNLATMHRRLGNRDDAAEYGKLARVAKGPDAKQLDTNNSIPPIPTVAKRPASDRQAATTKKKASSSRRVARRVTSRSTRVR